jgi:N-acetylmuramoyl-L-alanine amidase
MVPTAAMVAVMTIGPALAGAALAADPTVVVKSGDTLTAIAKRHGVKISAIVTANRIADANRIYAGQRLVIPSTPVPAAAPRPAAPVPAAAPARPAAAPRVHVVARGENLTRIAKRYGVTVAAIVQANRIANPSRIFAGQRFTIPGAQAPAAVSAAVPRPAAPAAMPPSMAALVAKRDGIRHVITEEANRYRVPVAFALAVAWQESGWQQGVVSHAGAVGVMQLMPDTAAWVGEAMLGTRVDIRDARHNVRAGVRLLAHYLNRYDGNRDLVLAAYFQGQTAADRHGVYKVSRSYVASVKLLERIFGG